jgi:DNA-binding transcriptional ArsR family regulator
MAGSKPRESNLFTALGHPTRRKILREMLDRGGESSPGELALRLDEPLCALSYHVRTLAQCKALELVRTERVGGSKQRFYRAAVETPWVLSALSAETED